MINLTRLILIRSTLQITICNCNYQIHYFKMGCVTGKASNNKKQLSQSNNSYPNANKKEEEQIPTFQIIPPMHPNIQPQNKKEKQMPEEGPAPSDINLSGKPVWTGNELLEVPPGGQQKINQSPINIIYSSNSSAVSHNKDPVFRFKNEVKPIVQQAEINSQESRKISKKLFTHQQTPESKRKSVPLDSNSRIKSNFIETEKDKSDYKSKYDFSNKLLQIGQQQYLESQRTEFYLRRVEILTNVKA